MGLVDEPADALEDRVSIAKAKSLKITVIPRWRSRGMGLLRRSRPTWDRLFGRPARAR